MYDPHCRETVHLDQIRLVQLPPSDWVAPFLNQPLLLDPDLLETLTIWMRLELLNLQIGSLNGINRTQVNCKPSCYCMIAHTSGLKNLNLQKHLWESFRMPIHFSDFVFSTDLCDFCPANIQWISHVLEHIFKMMCELIILNCPLPHSAYRIVDIDCKC